MPADPAAPASRVEVIASVQRRRRWSTAEKVRLVEKSRQLTASISFAARRAGISPSPLFRRKRRVIEGGPEADRTGAEDALPNGSDAQPAYATLRDLGFDADDKLMHPLVPARPHDAVVGRVSRALRDDDLLPEGDLDRRNLTVSRRDTQPMGRPRRRRATPSARRR